MDVSQSDITLHMLIHIFNIKSLYHRKQSLGTLDKNQIDFISEICYNLQRGAFIPSSAQTLDYAKKQAIFIRKLANYKRGYKLRRISLVSKPTVATRIFKPILKQLSEK